MGYRADIAIDLTFHSPADLDTLLTQLGAPALVGRRQPEAAWAILARLSEYADGHLDGLHLTGWGAGNLLTGHDQLVALIARHSDGTIDGVAEDGWHWRDDLHHGHVTTTTIRDPVITAGPTLVEGRAPAQRTESTLRR